MGMKKIVDYMNPALSNQHTSLNTNNGRINFWCPTGMNPLIYNVEMDENA